MSALISDQLVLDLVRDYAARNDLPGAEGTVDLDTPLADLGLDSLSTAELLLGARADLVTRGVIDADATLLELPAVERVGDLIGLLRSLEV